MENNLIIKNKKLDCSFILVSLYLFLIIFFIILTKNSKSTNEYSDKAIKSLEKKFQKLENNLSEKVWDEYVGNGINYILKYFDEYVDIKNSYVDNKIVKFQFLLDDFFKEDNKIDIDKKLLIHKIILLLKNNNKLSLKILIGYNQLGTALNQLKIINDYIEHYNVDIQIEIGIIQSDNNQISFVFLNK